MLRIAVPNKGVLSEPAAEMLAESGYRQRRTSKDLAVYDPDNDTEFFYLRPRDIAIYVSNGVLDLGITGRDLLLDSETDLVELLPLRFGKAAFYCDAYPEPPGFAEADAGAPGGYYDKTLREFILPYDAVRQGGDALLLGFLQSTYAAAADNAHWDRDALERRD